MARLRRGGGGRGLNHTEVAGRPQELGRGAGEGGGRVWCQRREERSLPRCMAADRGEGKPGK